MRRLISLIGLAAVRLANQPALTACMLLGMVLAVAIAASIPIFVGGAQGRVLQNELNTQRYERDVEGRQVGQAVPFAMRFSFLSLGRDVLSWAEFEDLESYMRTHVEPNTLLPLRHVTRYVASDNWSVNAGGDTIAKYKDDGAKDLGYLSFDHVSRIEQHIALDEGQLPADFVAPAETPMLEALMHREQANKLGIRAGDVLSLTTSENFVTAVDGKNTGEGKKLSQISVRVTGIWNPVNAADEYWMVRPSNLSDALIISPFTFKSHLAPLRDKFITLGIWSYALDESALNIETAPQLLQRAQQIQQDLEAKRSGMDMTQSALVRGLDRYMKAARELSTIMLVFSLPIFTVILSFILLMSGMVIRQQEAELAILRSRGAGSADVLWLYVVQGAALAALAFALGMVMAYLVAWIMLNMRTFLQVNPFDQWLRPSLPGTTSLRYGAIMATLSALLSLIPAVGAARRNILNYASERGRPMRAPFWQRTFLDVLLLTFCGYLYYQLRNTGTLGPGLALSSADPLKDPLRFVLPMLMLTGMGLLAGRILPLLFRLIAHLLAPIRATTPLFLAFRDLARVPGNYLAPTLLLIFTLGIAAYGASIAQTLDRHLHDTVYLTHGADVRLVETGTTNRPTTLGAPTPISDGDELEMMTFEPVEGHFELPGVQAYARVARINVMGRNTRRVQNDDKSQLMVIERGNFQQVAAPAFRDDYTGRAFNASVNELARSPDSILVDQRWFDTNNLRVGSKLPMELMVFGDRVIVTYTIRGTFSLFPVLAGSDTNFEKGNFFVANMDYTFERLGREVSYDVLLKTNGTTEGFALARAASEKGFIVFDVKDANREISLQQQRPERQGLFGIISAGFVFMSVLTLIGFAAYAILSHRRRAIELGVLRALGLSQAQMALYLAVSQIVLVALGSGFGVAIGVAISYMFIPLLQVTGSLVANVPPFLPRVAWDSVLMLNLALALTLLVVLGSSLLFLRQLRAFEAVKLGATV